MKLQLQLKIENLDHFIEHVAQLDRKGVIDWDHLSENISYEADLSAFMIKFSDRINWTNLSSNETTKWDMKMILNFEELLDFKELSRNPSIPFNDYLIAQYRNKWSWDLLSNNPSFPIKLETMREFEENIDWVALGLNRSLECRTYSTWESEYIGQEESDHMEICLAILVRYRRKWKLTERSKSPETVEKDSIGNNPSIDFDLLIAKWEERGIYIDENGEIVQK